MANARVTRRFRRMIRPAIEQLEARVVPTLYPSYPTDEVVHQIHPDTSGVLTPPQVHTLYRTDQLAFTGGWQMAGQGQTIAILSTWDDYHKDLVGSIFVDPGQPNNWMANANYSSNGNLIHYFNENLPNGNTTGNPLGITDFTTPGQGPFYTQVTAKGNPSTDGTSAGLPSPSSPPSGNEFVLDVEWSHAMAPGANIIQVLVDTAHVDWSDGIQAAITAANYLGVEISVITSSYAVWGGTTVSQYEAEVATYAVQGPNPTHPPITFVNSAGDGGAGYQYIPGNPDSQAPPTNQHVGDYGYQLQNSEAQLPYVVQIGGTVITPSQFNHWSPSQGGTPEYAWGSDIFSSRLGEVGNEVVGFDGSDGGFSVSYAGNPYQQAYVNNPNHQVTIPGYGSMSGTSFADYWLNYTTSEGWAASIPFTGTNAPQTPTFAPPRFGPDISLISLYLGVYTSDTQGNLGWLIDGGTSLAAPLSAGLMAIANQGRASVGLPPLQGEQTLEMFYSAPVNAFSDITLASSEHGKIHYKNPITHHDTVPSGNGFPVGSGYDLVTGLGSPNAAILVPWLMTANTVSTLTGPAGPVSYGQLATFTATVSTKYGDGTPLGTVTFMDGNTVLAAVPLIPDGGGATSSTATFAISDLLVGSHNISVVYNGDDPFNGSTSSPATVTVIPGPIPIVVGAGPGQNPELRVFSSDTNAVIASFLAYDAAYQFGVRVALGDVDGDGIQDFITAPGAGGGPHIKVFAGNDYTVIRSFMAYDGFYGGVYVASGDINNDGFDDIITGAGFGGGPHVKVFSGIDGTVLSSFMAYGATFPGGVRVAAGDINNDNFDDVITGAGPGGGPHVKVVSGQDQSLLRSFMAYDNFYGGIFVASGDLDGDGFDDVITGPGIGGGPHVKAFAGTDSTVIRSFMAFGTSFLGGVRVAASDLDGDGFDDILTGAGPGGGPHVKAFDGVSLAVVDSFFAFTSTFGGGVFVGGRI